MNKVTQLIYRIREKITAVSLLIVIGLILTGCTQQAETNGQADNEGYSRIYYLDTNGTKMVTEEYKPSGTTKEELVKEYLKVLSTDPKDITMKKAKPDNIKVEDFNFNEDGILTINFNSNYNTLTGIAEILCRATIVKTLGQIEGVDYIEFYVNGIPLIGSNDKPVGMMQDSDFIVDTDAEKVYFTVYYSNKSGNALVETNLMIPYNENRSVEELIIQQLINGPIKELQDDVLKTLPEGTELIKATTKDNICYVDFNKNFLNNVQGIDDEVIIYSVVNSLVELPSVNKVQFTIDGSPVKTYGDAIAFDGLFERNLEIVEGSK